MMRCSRWSFVVLRSQEKEGWRVCARWKHLLRARGTLGGMGMGILRSVTADFEVGGISIVVAVHVYLVVRRGSNMGAPLNIAFCWESEARF